jgi:hypothetical protein
MAAKKEKGSVFLMPEYPMWSEPAHVAAYSQYEQLTPVSKATGFEGSEAGKSDFV